MPTLYPDRDLYGYGAIDEERVEHGSCENSASSASSGDCDDDNPMTHPGADEAPGDGIDQNCDGNDSPGVQPPINEGGVGGKSSQGGDAGRGGAGNASGGSASKPEPSSELPGSAEGDSASSGCGCRVAGVPQTGSNARWTLLVGAVAVVGYRRRRAARP